MDICHFLFSHIHCQVVGWTCVLLIGFFLLFLIPLFPLEDYGSRSTTAFDEASGDSDTLGGLLIMTGKAFRLMMAMGRTLWDEDHEPGQRDSL